MVPLLSVHAAAAGAAMLKKHRWAGTVRRTSVLVSEESGFGRSPVLLAGNEGPGWIG